MRTVMRCLCLQHSCDHTPKSRSCLAPTTSCGCRRFICWEAVTKPCITVEMLLRRPPALYLCHLHLDAFASLFDFRFRQRRISARFMLWETVTLSRAKPWITLGQWFTGLDVSPKANLCWAHSSLSIAGQSATAYDVGCSLSAHTSRGLALDLARALGGDDVTNDGGVAGLGARGAD